MPKELKVVIVGDASALNKTFASSAAGADTFGKKMENIGGQITSVGKKLTLGVTTPLVAAGVASFKMASDFQTSMSRVVGLAGQSQKQVDAWQKDLIRLGPQLGKGPRELADALYFTASAGIKTAHVLDVVKVSAKASAAGLGETQTVADAVTSAMNAYGESNLSAAQAADVLVATVREGKGEASAFAPVIGNVASFAAQLGVNFNEVGAALASMTRLGTDAQTAATQLQAMFSNLVRPTKQVKDALKELGTTQEDVVASLQKKGLLATLQDLKARADGNTKALIPLFGNIRALRGAFALVGKQGDVVAQVFKRMGDSTGSLAKAFGEAQKTSGFTMDQFRASVEAAGIAIGTILAPIVEKIAAFLTRMSIAFQNLDPQTQKLIITFAAIAAAIGPVLIIVGSLVGAIGTLIPVLAALASGPGLVVVALAALVAAMAAAVLWPDKLQAALERMGISAKTSKEIVDDLRNAFSAIEAVVKAVWPAIQAIVVPTLNVIKGILMIVSGILRGDFSEAWKGVKIVIVNELRAALAVITAFPRIVLGVAQQIGGAVLHGIAAGLQALPGVVRKGLAALPGILSNVASKAFGWAVDIGKAIVDGVMSGAAGLGARLGSFLADHVRQAIDHVKALFGMHSPSKVTADEVGKPLAEGIVIGFVEGIKDFPNRSSQSMKNAVVAARATFLQASALLGRDGAMKIVEGFRTQQPSLAEQIKAGLVQGIKDALAAAHQAVLDAKGTFESAFSDLASSALSAFDKVTSQHKTPTEKKISREDEQRAAASRQQALADATAALAAARALQPNEGESPEDFTKRQLDAIKAAQQQYEDALFAIRRAADEKQAAQERAAYDASRERRRVNFEQQLNALEALLEKGHISAAQFRRRVLALFEKFDVPFKAAGQTLGAAIAASLHESFGSAVKGAADLLAALAEELRKKKLVISVDVQNNTSRTPGRASGGPVRAGSSYIVGERGPELFIPKVPGTIVPSLAGGGGMAEIHTNVYLDSTQIAEVIRREYLRFEKRNGRAAI